MIPWTLPFLQALVAETLQAACCKEDLQCPKQFVPVPDDVSVRMGSLWAVYRFNSAESALCRFPIVQAVLAWTTTCSQAARLFKRNIDPDPLENLGYWAILPVDPIDELLQRLQILLAAVLSWVFKVLKLWIMRQVQQFPRHLITNVDVNSAVTRWTSIHSALIKTLLFALIGKGTEQ